MIFEYFCGLTAFLKTSLKLLSIDFVVLYLKPIARSIYLIVSFVSTQVNTKMSTKSFPKKKLIVFIKMISIPLQRIFLKEKKLIKILNRDS